MKASLIPSFTDGNCLQRFCWYLRGRSPEAQKCNLPPCYHLAACSVQHLRICITCPCDFFCTDRCKGHHAAPCTTKILPYSPVPTAEGVNKSDHDSAAGLLPSVLFPCRYPEGTPGLNVRSDGSALVYWPSGTIAATLDPEDAVTTSKYRLLAMYAPSGNVAATFDSAGGFLQHASGALMLVWNRRDGQGSLYDAEGSLEARWSR